MFISPIFWIAVLVIGVVGLVLASKMNMLNNTAVAVVISMLISISYYLLVDHYLMDMQGLDYWYLFRE